MPGNFQFGEAGLVRTRRAPTTYWRDDYPAIADAVLSGELAGELAGSSAGGEQPKFTVYSEEKSSYVIVKFSPTGHEADARRWRDILITEYHATETLHAGSVAAAKVELVEKGDRLFLESERFDRTGHYGRSSMISLQMIDAEFVGDGANWPTVMTRLANQNLISPEHLQDACLLWFGYLVNNTDMHLGNMSLGMLDNAFNLLPSYDMCSMGFAPMRGVLKPLSFSPKPGHSRLDCLQGNEPMQKKARSLASNFWARVANDDRISDDFKEFLSRGNPINDLPAQ